MPKMTRTELLGYGVAVLATVAVLLIRLLLDPFLEEHLALFLFLIAVMASAWYGGVRAGLLSTFLCALFTSYFLIEPFHSFSVAAANDKLMLVLFIGVGALISVLAEALHATRRRAEASALDALSGQRQLQDEVAKRKLQESESRFTAFMNNSLAVAWMKDADGRFVYVNEPFARSFQRPVEWWIGRTEFDYWPPEVSEKLRASDQAVLTSGQAQELIERVPLPNGQMRDWLAIKFPITSTSGQQWIGGMAIDIHERKRAEEKFRWLLESTPAGMVIVNGRGEIVLVNSEAERLFGYRREELLGQPVEILIPERYRSRHTGHRMGYMADPRARPMGAGLELYGLRKDGSEFPVAIGLRPLETEDGLLVSSAISDLTDRKRVEQALFQAQKMEAIGQLTGGVAHDFNNLLTIISGNLQMLGDRVKDDAFLHKLVMAASKASARGAELVRRLLAFARRQVLQPQAVNLNQLVAGMMPLLHRTLGENIKITAVESPGLWPALADSGQVETALLNLAVNARDAMPKGGRLTLETANVCLDEAYAASEAEVSPGEYVMLAVSDSGIGMSEETKRRAFEPFFTTKGSGKGSGLGLSMVYGFVKQSGGHVKIYSEIGQGATVKLYLPRAKSATRPAMEAPTPAMEPSRGGETILVVEDDAVVCELAVIFLTGLGYRVLKAADSLSALALLEEGYWIDLLFVDLVLSGAMSGVDLAIEAKRLQPALRVLYTSGYPRNTIVHNGRLGEGAFLLPKPYTREDLGRAVRGILDAQGK